MTANILLQLDTDLSPSTFDGVVAIDAGVDHLLTRGGLDATSVTPLVYGLMFTRGGEELRHSAIFIGGSDVSAAQRLLLAVRETFFGDNRVSVMLDANGCNTTAAAAVVSAARHVNLAESRVVILGGTGPVGRRAAQMCATEGAEVVVTSRDQSRAAEACGEIREMNDQAKLIDMAAGTPETTSHALAGANVIISCGAAGVELASLEMLDAIETLQVAIDLNAVPPAGLGGISMKDKAVRISDTAVGYGAIGVGGLKMKTHQAAVRQLFKSNDQVLDAAEIFEIAKAI